MAALQIGQVENPLQWERWSEARAMLDPALSRSDETWETIEPQLEAGSMQLIGVLSEGGDLSAAAVTKFVETPKGEIFEIFICGGKGFREWAADLAETLAAAAQRNGCLGIRTWGRPGWRNVLQPLGWKSDVMCFERGFASAGGV